MGDLPPIEHGGWIWAGSLLLSAVATALIYGQWRRWRAERVLGALAPAVAGRETGVDALRDGVPAVLRGTLRNRSAGGPAAATLTARPRNGIRQQSVRVSAAAADLRLEIDGDGGARVRLRGPARVLVPARERVYRRRLPRLPALLRDGARCLVLDYPWVGDSKGAAGSLSLGEARVGTVAGGDQVFVAGVARSRAATGATGGYREPAQSWELEPGEPGELLVAAAGRARRLFRPTARWLAASAALGGLFGLLAFWIGARTAAGCAGEERAAAAWSDRRAVDPTINRAWATIDAIENRRRGDLDRVEAERRAVLRSLPGRCVEQARAFEARRRYDDAIEAWRRCDDDDGTAVIWNLMQLGRMGEAADLAAAQQPAADPLRFHAVLLDRRWRTAAAIAAELAAAEDTAASKLRWHCLDLALRYRAGDGRTLAGLRRAAADRDGYHCVPLLAIALPPTERAALLASWLDRMQRRERRPAPLRYSDLPSLNALLLIEAAPEQMTSIDEAHAWRTDLVNVLDPNAGRAPHWWMAGHVLAAADRELGDEPSAVRARLIEVQAAHALVAGDPVAAGELAGRAKAMWRRVPEAEWRDHGIHPQVGYLHNAIAYRSGGQVAPELEQFGRHVRLRRGLPPGEEWWLVGPLNEERKDILRSALAQAAAGDGLALAAELQTTRYFRQEEWVFAVAPRLTSGARELADALPWADDSTDGIGQPGAWALRAAAYRDLFGLLGRKEEAARWRARAEVRFGLMSDRDLLVFTAVAAAP